MRRVLVSSLLLVGCSGGPRRPPPTPAPLTDAALPVGEPELTRDDCEEGIGHQDRLLENESPLSPETIEPLIAERARDHAELVEACVKTGTRAQYECVMQAQTVGDCEDTGPF